MEQKNIFVKNEVTHFEQVFLHDREVKLEKDIPIIVKDEKVDEVYQCSECCKKYKKAEYVTIHSAIHNPDKSCLVCFKSFTCKKKFEVHLNRHIRTAMDDEKKTSYDCDYCGKKFMYMKKLIIHIRVHTNERPYKCKICGEGFKQLGTLKAHHVTHTKQKQFICEICEGSFTTGSSLKRHKRKIHEKGKSLKCKWCGAIFLNMADFRQHRRDTHPKAIFTRTCPLCSEVFYSRAFYRKHREYHNEHLSNDNKVFLKNHMCLLCGEKYMQFEQYLDHRNTHLGYTDSELHEANKNNLYKCKLCPKEVKFKNTLFRHMDVHMEKKFQCDLCNAVSTFYKLRAHMREVHKEGYCQVCHKVIIGMASLRYHYQRYHPSNKEKFRCNVCRRQYLSEQRLNLHIKEVHENKAVKNYKCTYCEKRFLNSFILGSHLLLLHKKKTKRRCTLCNITFDTQKLYFQHKLLHMEDKTIRNRKKQWKYNKFTRRFRCKTCKKIFKTLSNYMTHVTLKVCVNFIDRMRRKRKCGICSKSLASAATLKMHMQLHSNNLHRCRICGKIYKQVELMRRHIKVAHPKEKLYWCYSCKEGFDRVYDFNIHLNSHKAKWSITDVHDGCIVSDSIKEEEVKIEETQQNLKEEVDYS